MLFMILLYVCAFLLILYFFTIINYWLAWKQIPVFQPSAHSSTIRFSVIIAARNEEENIGPLIEDLQQQHYPSHLYELIIVDDHSTDSTAEVVKKYPGIKLVQLTGMQINSYKKKAIETGISVSANEWIVTTDADCRLQPDWLSTLAAYIEKEKKLVIAGPVYMSHEAKPLQIFQTIDFMMLQGITGSAIYKNMHSMGNGANLCYSKKAFQEVQGFAGIDQIASGDDMLLLYKIGQHQPDQIGYLKSAQAIVTTPAEKTRKAFINQRIRWASKSRKYQDKRLFPILLMVYLFNLSFIVLLVAGSWNYQYWLALVIMLLLKTGIELPFFISVSRFFNKQRLWRPFILFQPMHILYTIISGLLGQLGTYEWKGRRVR